MKRSVKVGNRNTTIVLEKEFCEALRDIAEETGESVQTILHRIEFDSDLNCQNFTSCVRVFVIEYYRNKAHNSRRH